MNCVFCHVKGSELVNADCGSLFSLSVPPSTPAKTVDTVHRAYFSVNAELCAVLSERSAWHSVTCCTHTNNIDICAARHLATFATEYRNHCRCAKILFC